MVYKSQVPHPIVLTLLPNEPVTALTTATPYQAWLTFTRRYLLLRYWAPRQGDLLTAILGGLYSSTATIVALALPRRRSLLYVGAVAEGAAPLCVRGGIR